MKRLLGFWLACLMIACVGCARSETSATPSPDPRTPEPSASELKNAAEDGSMVSIDFRQRAGTPLFKKFGLFNSGLLNMDVYERDAHLMDELVADSLRIDLYIGGDGTLFDRAVDGTEDKLTYDFTRMDEMVKLLYAHGIKPYWSWCYIPKPLQIDHDWRSGPSSLAAWEDMYRAFAKHYKDIGIKIPYNEVYNEPDCNGVFFSGTWEDYTQMYIHAARGLLAGDPDAVIGGPSTAFIEKTGKRKLQDFLGAVKEAKVPLDFFSYHSYGYQENQYQMRTETAQNTLSADPAFDTTELHFNEYNAILQPFSPHNATEHTMGAVQMLNTFNYLLDQGDVTLAHWAQYMDNVYEQLGMVGIDGRRKAGFFSFYAYGRMPEERVALQGLPPAVHGFAAGNASRAGVLLWNDREESASLRLNLSSLGMTEGTARIYEMNDESDPYWNGTETAIKPVGEKAFTDSVLEWQGTIAGPGIVYIEIGEAPPKPVKLPYTLVRRHYYFPERGKANYSFYDERQNAVYLGMGGESSARSLVGITVDDAPDFLRLHADSIGGYTQIDSNSAFAVRVDYDVGGKPTRAVEYRFMPQNPRRQVLFPWGTQKAPDVIHSATSLYTGTETLDLRADAPEGWTGRVTLSFDMHSIGPDAQARVQIQGI